MLQLRAELRRRKAAGKTDIAIRRGVIIKLPANTPHPWRSSHDNVANLPCLLFNARSVWNKWKDIADDIAFNYQLHLPYLIAITETWLSPGDVFNFYLFETFNILRATCLRVGGGVALLLHPSIRFTPAAVNYVCNYLSILCYNIMSSSSITCFFRCIVVYRPPTCIASALTNLCRALTTIIANTWQDIILLGDFNFPRADWLTMSVHGNDAQTSRFVDACLHHGLTHLVSSPTLVHNESLFRAHYVDYFYVSVLHRDTTNWHVTNTNVLNLLIFPSRGATTV